MSLSPAVKGRLNDLRRLVDAPDGDLFDVLAYVLYDHPPKTREERPDNVRQAGLEKADGELGQPLLGIFQAYEIHCENELASTKLSSFMIGRYGSVTDGRTLLGDLPAVIRHSRRTFARPDEYLKEPGLSFDRSIPERAILRP